MPVWFVVACCGPAAAASAGVHLGAAELKPRLGLEASYDDNIFLQSVTPTGSTILRVTPGLDVRLERKRMKLRGGYELSSLNYAIFPKANNALHQTGYVAFSQEFAKAASFSLEEAFKATTDPASSELTERAKRAQNDVGIGLELPLSGKTFAGVRVSDTLTCYRRASLAALLDRDEVLAGLRGGYVLTAKTRTYAFARYASVAYVTNLSNESSGLLAGAGLQGEITKRITGTLELGSMSRHYTRTVSGGTRDTTAPRYDVALTWEGPRDWKVRVNGERGFSDSVFNRFFVTSALGGNVSKPLGKHAKVAVLGSWGLDQYPDLNPEFAR
ncbi:MAG: outer membrane beta-barrel protein, partial [bacterium]